ncbi:hypothetical protein D3C79_504380 [compost metagenome]
MADPAKVFGVLGRGHAKLLAAIGDVVDVLGQVGVQRHPILARQHGSFAHQVAADRERRAWRDYDAAHRAVAGIVVVLDQALRFLEDVGFLFHHRVRWQAALALAHAHAAARGMEAHADLGRRVDAVVELAAVGVDVQVVAGGGAAGQDQLGHGGLGRHRDHLGGQARPDRVQVGQPVEQLAILSGRYHAGEALVHVMVGVDQAWDNHLAGHVQNHVGVLREGFAGADLLDQVVFDEQAAVLDFAAFAVHGDQQCGVFDEERFCRVCR